MLLLPTTPVCLYAAGENVSHRDDRLGAPCGLRRARPGSLFNLVGFEKLEPLAPAATSPPPLSRGAAHHPAPPPPPNHAVKCPPPWPSRYERPSLQLAGVRTDRQRGGGAAGGGDDDSGARMRVVLQPLYLPPAPVYVIDSNAHGKVCVPQWKSAERASDCDARTKMLRAPLAKGSSPAARRLVVVPTGSCSCTPPRSPSPARPASRRSLPRRITV